MLNRRWPMMLLMFAAAWPRGASAQQPRPSAPGLKPAGNGYMLDFDDQDIKVVLSALAAASGANVTYNNIPAKRTTLRMGTPVPKDSLVPLIRSVAEANGLRVQQLGGLLRIDYETPLTPQQIAAQNQQRIQQQLFTPPQLQLYTYRLKHASAQDLAVVLTSIFSGAPGRGNVNNGFVQAFPSVGTAQILTPQGFVQVTPNAVPDAGRGGGGGGGGGGAGRFGGGGGGGGGGFLAQQLAQQLATQGAGALSTAANDIRVVAEVSTNSLIVRATQQDWNLIQQILQAVDLRPLQVLIEVTIAEVEHTSDWDFGISGSVGHHAKTPNGTSDSLAIPPTGTARDLVLTLAGAGGGIDFNLAINALEERGQVRVLSLPIVIAQNNKQAVLNVGTSQPFVQVTQSAITGVPTGLIQTIQYIDVGTKLTITPIVNPDGYVNMTVDQTDDAATNEVQFNAPVITKREATTQVFLRNGQTTVIGGLSGRSYNRNDSGIPYLSRLPLIGALFGGTSRSQATSELFVFLTPHVISGDDDIDRLRDAIQKGTLLLKQQDFAPMLKTTADTLLTPPPEPLIRRDTSRTDSSRVRRLPPSSRGRVRPDTTAGGGR